MKHLLFLIFLCAIAFFGRAQSLTGPEGEKFSLAVLAGGLQDPWQLRLDEKGYMWFTESRALRVVRMELASKRLVTVLDLSGTVNYKRYDTIDDKRDGGKPWPAGGLMGLALHPQFYNGHPYVYFNYIASFEGATKTGKGCRGEHGGCYFTARLVRYRFDERQNTLKEPEVLADNIPASNDHNGSRILIAPVEGKNYLFYAIGDMGAGQFTNAGRRNHAQDTAVYEGKILRFNIEPDADGDRYERWIPNDNPFNRRRQNAVWTYGHRNPQGLFYAVIGSRGILYSSEHGPYSDDEVNIIDKGKNYGHPLIIGFADGNYDGLAAGVTSDKTLPNRWHSTYPDITSEAGHAEKMGESFRPPLFSFYPTAKDSLFPIFQALVKNDETKQEWRSEAPSSIAVYTSDAIPGWKNSVLLPCLKTGRLMRLKLSPDGMDVSGDTLAYFSGTLRYRDVAVSTDGRTIYMAVDKSSITSGPSEKDEGKSSYRGAILAFRFEGGAKQ